MTLIENVTRIATEAMLTADKARERADRAWAEVARLNLIKLADEDERITGLSFESEYQYDDEGGYFLTSSVYPIMEGDLLEVEVDPDYDFSDAMTAYGNDVLAVLCGVAQDAYQGQITIEEARQRRF